MKDLWYGRHPAQRVVVVNNQAMGCWSLRRLKTGVQDAMQRVDSCRETSGVGPKIPNKKVCWWAIQREILRKIQQSRSVHLLIFWSVHHKVQRA